MPNYNIDIHLWNGSQYININDYVIDCSDIPFFELNDDYKTIISNFELVLSKKIQSEAGIELQIDSACYVQIGYQTIFSGFVFDIQENFANPNYVLQIYSDLQKLTERYCNYDEFHGLLLSTDSMNNYCASTEDDEGYGSAKVLYLLELMFEKIGCEIDLEDVRNKIIFNDTFSSIPTDVILNNINIDEFAFYAINQSSVTKYDDDKDYGLVTSFFEFLQICCSFFGLFIAPAENKKFKLYDRLYGDYNISDNTKYEYIRINKLARHTSYNYQWSFGNQIGLNYRNGYNQDAVSSIVIQKEQDEGTEEINIPQNLFFLARRRRPVQILNITSSGSLTYIDVDSIFGYTAQGGLGNSHYIEITGVEGMTEINGIHRIVSVSSAIKRFTINFTPTNAYTSGGTVDHAGIVYPDHYWNFTDLDKTDEGIANQAKVIIQNKYEIEVTTNIKNTRFNALKNSINIINDRSTILMQEFYG